MFSKYCCDETIVAKARRASILILRRKRRTGFGASGKPASTAFGGSAQELGATRGNRADAPVGRHRGPRSPNPQKSLQSASEQQHKRCHILASILIAIYCVFVGGIFLGMAAQGDSECRALLGDVLWEGSVPRYVIVTDGRQGGVAVEGSFRIGSFRGGCNLLAQPSS